jgi:N6-adenosine-specific RNA methylase IME4
MTGNKKYDIIYADPPWNYPHDQSHFGQDVKRHYNTMSKEELKKMDIKSITETDCVLYLWATAPLLPTCLEVLEAWGFKYKSCLVWDKVKHNMGFYSSVRHEIILIGGKGKSAPTDKKYANRIDSVFVEERREHSRKPDYFYEMIEKCHPLKTKKIELFARTTRNGWDAFGNETNKFIGVD